MFWSRILNTLVSRPNAGGAVESSITLRQNVFVDNEHDLGSKHDLKLRANLRVYLTDYESVYTRLIIAQNVR